MKKIRAKVKTTDLLANKTEWLGLTVEAVGNGEWVLLHFEREVNESKIKTNFTTLDMLPVIGASCRRNIPEVQGLVVIDGGYEVPRILLEGLTDLLAGVCYARAGMLVKALALWKSAEVSLSAGAILQAILDDNLRKNLLAEALFGNGVAFEEVDVLNTRHFWGLDGEDPRQIYGKGKFYIHPAGLGHQKRVNGLEYLRVGQKVFLEAEPSNIHDPQAVHLWTEVGGDLAYLPAAIAATVSFHMRRGAKYSGWISCARESAVPYRRLAVQVYREEA